MTLELKTKIRKEKGRWKTFRSTQNQKNKTKYNEIKNEVKKSKR